MKGFENFENFEDIEVLKRVISLFYFLRVFAFPD